MIQFYKYLPKKEFINTWINGGEIPLKLASSFYSTERKETKTPDENQIRKLNSKYSSGQFNELYSKVFSIGAETEITNVRSNINISGSKFIINGKEIEDGSTTYKSKMIDGYIMCFSKTLSLEVAEKFNMFYAVQITDMNKLQKYISNQIPYPYTFDKKNCQYTNSINRNTFLKAIEDKWQDEYRFFLENQ